MDGWTVAWLAWGAMFAFIELPALFFAREPGATLSEHIWHWFHVRDERPTKTTWALRGLLALLLVILSTHLALGWP